jgi:hypothetical protein
MTREGKLKTVPLEKVMGTKMPCTLGGMENMLFYTIKK